MALYYHFIYPVKDTNYKHKKVKMRLFKYSPSEAHVLNVMTYHNTDVHDDEQLNEIDQ